MSNLHIRPVPPVNPDYINHHGFWHRLAFEPPELFTINDNPVCDGGYQTTPHTMYRTHTNCRACAGENLEPAISLGLQPLANSFRHPNGNHSGYAPLEVLRCKECGLGQLSVVVDPGWLYRNYLYETSKSETMVNHMNLIIGMIRSRLPLNREANVIEIGSNDGTFLRLWKSRFPDDRALGIEPSPDLAMRSRNSGIHTLDFMWDMDCGEYISKRFDKQDIVVARHVFCHVDSWLEFFQALQMVVQDECLIAIEVPYAKRMLERAEYDTIYHEHLSYLTLQSVKALMDRTDFDLYGFEELPIHGGSVLLFFRRKNSAIKYEESALKVAAEYIPLSDWKDCEEKMKQNSQLLHRRVVDLVCQGKSVAGLGASAKSTVQCCLSKLGPDLLGRIYDSTVAKIGRFSPCDIPVVSETQLAVDMPDYCVCFAWNFREEILRKNKDYTDRGGRFIFPPDEIAP